MIRDKLSALERRGAPGSTVLTSAVGLIIISVGFLIPGLVRTKSAAVFFGLEGVGIIGQLSQIQTVFISLGAAGVVTATRVIFSRSGLEAREEATTRDWVLVVPTGVALALSAVVVLLADSVAEVLLGDRAFRMLVIGAAIGIPIAVFGQIALSLAQVRASRRRLMLSALGAAFVSSCAVVGLLASGSYILAAFSFVGAPAVQVAAILIMCKEARPTLKAVPRISRAHRSEMFMLAWASAALGVYAATADLVGRTTVLHAYSIAEVARYQPIALIVTQIVGVALGALSTSTLLEVARSKTETSLVNSLNGLMASLIPLATIAISILAASGSIIITLFFSAEIAASTSSLLALALSGEVARVYAWTTGSVFLSRGFRKSWLLNGMITVSVQVFLGIFLGLRYGTEGIVIALVGANLVSAVLTFALLQLRGVAISRVDICVVVIIVFLFVAVHLFFAANALLWTMLLCAVVSLFYFIAARRRSASP